MKTGTTTSAARLTVLALAAALALTACGADGGETPADPSGGASGGESSTTAPATESEESESSEPAESDEADETDESETSASPSEGDDEDRDEHDEDDSADPSDEADASLDAGTSSSGPGSSAGGTEAAEQRARLEAMAPSILRAADLPGDVLVGEQRQAVVDEEFEMNMSVRGVEVAGECRQLIEQIDTFSRPGSAVGISQYQVDPSATGTIGAAEAFASAVITPEDEDIMGMFGQLPAVCGELSGADATAVFEPIEGAPGASRLVMEAGPERLELLMGGVSDGNEHLYTGYVNIETELAEQMLREQIAVFEARER